MDRKKANAIFKGSLIAMTVLLWEGSGICRNPYPVWAADDTETAAEAAEKTAE